VIGHLLNRTATVRRPSTAADEVGGQTVTLEDAGTLRVKVGQPSAEERQTADQWGARLTHVVHAHRAADIRRGDELDVGEAHLLRVLAVITDSRSTYQRAECEAFQAEGS
jgi:head-tail adaptor